MKRPDSCISSVRKPRAAPSELDYNTHTQLVVTSRPPSYDNQISLKPNSLPATPILINRGAPIKLVPEYRAPRMYKCVWYRTVFTVRQQSSYVRSSRVFTPAYCTVCTPSPRPVSAPRVLTGLRFP
ncbi:hypothetical protein EVAR_7624_1 [Eumeta japonica]|uniref:Uncharacterized protein n=1 Tax=Eumeta variegata TaxID=151549 RepID=A0A4C1TI47_EUMVA|nr:hypothetical protein EVAR_7624_1 [Eumeta japonica]